MLLVGDMVDSKLIIVDTDDLTIEAFTFNQIRNAVEHGIVIPDFDIKYLDSMKYLRADAIWRYETEYKMSSSQPYLNHRAWYSLFVNKVVRSHKWDLFMCLKYTYNSMDSDISGGIFFGDNFFGFDIACSDILVNGELASVYGLDCITYAGFYDEYFVIRFNRKTLWFTPTMCYFSKSISKNCVRVPIVQSTKTSKTDFMRNMLLRS